MVIGPPTNSLPSTTSPLAASSSRRTARARGRNVLAVLGEPNGAAQAVEEAGAELVFQLENLLRKRRLGNVRLFGGAAERAGLGHGAEVAELVEFHKKTSNQ